MTKINSVRRAFGLWCAFLAAGTWIQPIAVSAASSAPARVFPSVRVPGAWVGSEVELAWRFATGQSTDFEFTGIRLSGGAPDVPTQFSAVDLNTAENVPGTAAAWIPLGVLEIQAANSSEPTPDGGELESEVTLRIVAGSTLGASGEVGHFLGALYTVVGTISGPETDAPIEERDSLFLPFASYSSPALALARLDRLATVVAESASGSSGGEFPGCGDGGTSIECMHPTWLGRHGEQCCALHACWQKKIARCDSNWDKCMINCLMASTLGVGLAVLGCLKSKCKILIHPLLVEKCVLICIGVGVAGELLSMVYCANLCDQAWSDCTGAANDWYFEKCFDVGCSLKPQGSGSSIEAILDQQATLKGGDLDTSTSNQP